MPGSPNGEDTGAALTRGRPALSCGPSDVPCRSNCPGGSGGTRSSARCSGARPLHRQGQGVGAAGAAVEVTAGRRRCRALLGRVLKASQELSKFPKNVQEVQVRNRYSGRERRRLLLLYRKVRLQHRAVASGVLPRVSRRARDGLVSRRISWWTFRSSYSFREQLLTTSSSLVPRSPWRQSRRTRPSRRPRGPYSAARASRRRSTPFNRGLSAGWRSWLQRTPSVDRHPLGPEGSRR